MKIRICVDCGDRKEVVRIQKGIQRCKPCSLIARTKSIGGYDRVCVDCGDSKWFRYPPRTDICLACVMKKRKKSHVRVCIDCGDERQVASLAGTINKRCRECEGIERKKLNSSTKEVKPRKAKVTKPRVRKKSKHVSKQAIERVRAINKEHRAANKAKKEVKPMNDPDKDRMMIESFYENNKVIHVDCAELYGQTTLRMNGRD